MRLMIAALACAALLGPIAAQAESGGVSGANPDGAGTAPSAGGGNPVASGTTGAGVAAQTQPPASTDGGTKAPLPGGPGTPPAYAPGAAGTTGSATAPKQ